ncbi:Hepcidin antimicrobial peptide 2 [Apodemus speciosus]|uniref:Hepcidin antimicrobial peptide 2 n=1 Tax=Apodemus speciosus TaxID=105296 RepID=A0ABQ0EY03_APOSI
MALSTRTQAACLLLLLLAGLSSGAYLQQQMRQTTELQALPRAEDRTDSALPVQMRRTRDANFPVCLFCCNCCGNLLCGFCCKT